MRYGNLLEEELKSRIAQEYFGEFDGSKIIGKVDFCVTVKTENATPELSLQSTETQSLLWGEAKKGQADIYASLVQLIITIGKARTFDAHLPPAFLAAFDAEKMAFVPYSEVADIFYQNDFNWNVAPSNYETKEFKQVYDRVKDILDAKFLIFRYQKDDQDLRLFIKENFVVGKVGATKIKIDKNNFITIYSKWLNAVKPTIAVNWEVAKKSDLIDADFYLADLLSKDNVTLKDKLYVLLRSDQYVFNRKLNEAGFFDSSSTTFLDKQKAHTQFWNKYERPPAEEYWDYIVDRRDLLVPQDIRERKGSFFTPQIWVELSQRYLADYLGPDWQDEYYIWDCAAGTGNLLAGLTNKYNIWASTLDKQDVDVMKDRIQNGANLLEDHVFQFDFLNDDFSKLPKKLKDIIDDPEKRKKLVIYINPPYAESGTGVGRNFKTKVALEHKTNEKYKDKIGNAANELFVLFLARIYDEIQGSLIGHFSTLKILQGPNFFQFRSYFQAKLEKMFIVPAFSFDNVKGQFPIGFMVWNTFQKEVFKNAVAQIFFNSNLTPIGEKTFRTGADKKSYINSWLRLYFDKISEPIGIMHNNKNDFQHNQQVRITTNDIKDHTTPITKNNIFPMCVYFSVRHCVAKNWINNQDQFLFPDEGWALDKEFQTDCLAFSLFHGQNKTTATLGVNHWIPFTEYEVNSREKFDSNFMTRFIQGKLKPEINGNLLGEYQHRTTPLEFSKEAQAVFDAGRALWQYYHAQPNVNVNASLYDIREYFQGRTEGGKMNMKSVDESYTSYLNALRFQLNVLARKIEPKVYDYGFLKR